MTILWQFQKFWTNRKLLKIMQPFLLWKKKQNFHFFLKPWKLTNFQSKAPQNKTHKKKQQQKKKQKKNKKKTKNPPF